MKCLKTVWELPKTEVKTRYDAVDRFLEDLGRVEDLCQSPSSLGYPEYERLKRFVCNGGVDAVADDPWDYVIAFATYYLIFHRRDLEAAQRALELLEFRNLDDEGEAMLKILQVAYEVAANPPCSDPEALRRYVKKVRNVPEPSRRVQLLKTLVLMHLTDVDVEAFKNKIAREFKDDSIIEWRCEGEGCTKKVVYRPKPFHHFAFYIADRAKPLCPKPPQSQSASVFEECLDTWKNFRKVAEAAFVPFVTAVVALLVASLLYLFPLFIILIAFYTLWTFYMYKKYTSWGEPPVCLNDVWRATWWMVALGNAAPTAAFLSILAAAYHESNPPLMAAVLFGFFFAWLNMFTMAALVMPGQPRVGFPKTGARDESSEYGRFIEDLADTWDMRNICGGWLPYEHYNKLRALVCSGGLDAAGKVSEGWPLLISAYYLMFHKRGLETAQKVLELLRSRNLDEKEKAALEILEVAREAAANPPCGNTKAFLEKISRVQTSGWASLLKALVAAHLTCGQDYKDDVKRAVLWTVERCRCDNLSICYFAYRILNRIKPLCRCPA
jgi:hypothetical protein